MELLDEVWTFMSIGVWGRVGTDVYPASPQAWICICSIEPSRLMAAGQFADEGTGGIHKAF